MEQLLDQTRQSNLLNLFGYVTPVFMLMIIAEWGFSKIEKHDYYDSRDTLANSIIGIGNLAVMAGIKFVYLSVIVSLYIISPFKIPFTWWSFILCLILIDFIGYWVHRLSHESRFFWATHITHHSSEKFNYGINLRVGWTVHLKLLFFVPLLLAGIHPVEYMICYQIDTSYQFWIHTEYIKKLPWLFEFIFVTPSHHRVHHGCNEKYLDRNYGVMLIIWDRIFGTFIEEDEKVRYGITKPVKSFNPIYLNFHEWVAIARDVSNSGSMHEAWQMLFARPGRIEAIKQNKKLEKGLKSLPVVSSPCESSQLSDGPSLSYKNIFNLLHLRGSIHKLKPNHPLKQLILIVCLSLFGFPSASKAQLRKNYRVDYDFVAADSDKIMEARFKRTDKAILTSVMHTLIPAGIGTIILVASNLLIFVDEDIWMVSGLFISYGALIGPFAGNFYARDAVRGALGIVLRTGRVFLFSTPNPQTRVIGDAIFFGSSIYNFATCEQSVNKYNERHFRSPNLSLNPKIDIPVNNYGIKMTIKFN